LPDLGGLTLGNAVSLGELGIGLVVIRLGLDVTSPTTSSFERPFIDTGDSPGQTVDSITAVAVPDTVVSVEEG